MPKNFSVDATLFKVKAKKLVKQLKLDEPTVVREQAALMSKLLSKVTPPFLGGKFPKMSGSGYQGGGVKDVEAAGNRAIKKDLGTIFRIKGREYLEFLHDVTGRLKNVRRNLRTKKGVSYVVDVDEINYDSVSRAVRFHQSKRLKNGRTPKYKGDVGIGRWKSRDVMWVTAEIWNAVFEAKAKNVGMSKAAFASAAVQLGVKQKPPSYIKRHIAGIGTTVSELKNPSRVTIRASAPGLSHTMRSLAKVERFRMEAMVKRMEKIIRANAKKAGFKTR
jgi:hypothetical protein